MINFYNISFFLHIAKSIKKTSAPPSKGFIKKMIITL